MNRFVEIEQCSNGYIVIVDKIETIKYISPTFELLVDHLAQLFSEKSTLEKVTLTISNKYDESV